MTDAKEAEAAMEVDEVGEEILRMPTDEIEQRRKLIDNEIKTMRNESNRLTHEIEQSKEKIKENNEKIKLNKQLPYLVANVVEVPRKMSTPF